MRLEVKIKMDPGDLYTRAKAQRQDPVTEDDAPPEPLEVILMLEHPRTLRFRPVGLV